jgi:hypothetical protein
MGHDRQLRRSGWRLPRALGAVVLTAGALAVGLPAGTALAGTALASSALASSALASPAVPIGVSENSLLISTSVRALGHTWSFSVSNFGGDVEVFLSTVNKGATEEHTWGSGSTAFGSIGLKELKVTSTGHATWRTGSALSPVLAVSAAFTPVKATREACAKGSETIYTGKVSGTVSLVTGLHGVTVRLKLSGQRVGELTADKGCVEKPGKTFCSGGIWFVNGAGAEALGIQVLGMKPPWADALVSGPVRTASKWLTRTAGVAVNGPAPKLNKTAKTVTVGGFSSGGLTGTAVISYNNVSTQPPQTCFLGGKKFEETDTTYFGLTVTITKPLVAHSLLAGTLKLQKATAGSYLAVALTAA